MIKIRVFEYRFETLVPRPDLDSVWYSNEGAISACVDRNNQGYLVMVEVLPLETN